MDNNIKLVKKAMSGNEKAFEKLVKQESEKLYKTAFLYVRNKEDVMNKKHFKQEISEIEFPQNEVFQSINKGIKSGRREKSLGTKSPIKKWGIVSSLAASAFLASGLLFAPVTSVLASVPILGSIYEKFSLQIGMELLESNLITQLNEEAKSNGINMIITSAYYDGNVIGITFKATGDKISLDKIGDKGPETGYSFHLFNGKEQQQWSASMTVLEKMEDGYVAALEFYNPDANLPEDYTLPLTFTSITGVNGSWKFDIPVKQIPSETIATKGESIFKEEKDYSIYVDSVIKGKATTLLNYKTTYPLAGKNDEISLTVFDNEGTRLSKSHADVLSVKQRDNVIVKDTRELFTSKIKESTILIIQPEIRQYEEDTVSSLEKTSPFVIESKRFDYKLKVNDIKQSGKLLTIDYTILNVNSKEFRKDIIQNFADFIKLIKNDQISKETNGELNINKMLEHQILSNEAKLIDRTNLHFQSIFTINTDEFDKNEYSLMVPFGTLSSNKPIKMEPLEIELK
ncbi:DUF4179 domain-containing protein [Niallia sp.]|uniref:DUF4179 domain-containing protein n=1 Tax=Niallia sp. TaxID=2837523 RepID=UPI0028A13D88|nr:DUF4179 domain-containing protein [Niallia sp.]